MQTMKAVGLLSGGLDSTLAAKVLLEQGIEVAAINFTSPFCLCTPKSAGCLSVVTAVQELGRIDLKRVALEDDYLELVQHPKHGYGAGLNPCIDCRILKIKKAGEYMRAIGAAFLFTGEVLGQRPMSQHRQALDIIDRESGLAGLILRPLSAQLFPPTLPEQQGWVDREKLLAFSGRTRKPQIRLAADYGIADYPCPAGGCLLTDAGFARRMRDLMVHGRLTLAEVAALKIGRHFRLHDRARLIVGRNQDENNRLARLVSADDWQFEPVDVAGPTALGRGALMPDDLWRSAGLVARYCDSPRDAPTAIYVRRGAETAPRIVAATALSDDAIQQFRI